MLTDNSGHSAVALAVMAKNGMIDAYLRKTLKSSRMNGHRIVSSPGIARDRTGTVISSRKFHMGRTIHPERGEDFPFSVPHPK